MHVRIAYYSRKGTTEGLAGMVAEGLRGRGHRVTMVPVRHVKRAGFIGAGRASLKGGEMELANDEADYDLGDADLVVLGAPIFAGRVDPYTRTFVGRASGMEGKPGGVFVTCAAGPDDKDAYLDRIEDLAASKGLQVRARMFGSRKLRERYAQLAGAFVDQLVGDD